MFIYFTVALYSFAFLVIQDLEYQYGGNAKWERKEHKELNIKGKTNKATLALQYYYLTFD